jgi:hypothetical protein
MCRFVSRYKSYLHHSPPFSLPLYLSYVYPFLSFTVTFIYYTYHHYSPPAAVAVLFLRQLRNYSCKTVVQQNNRTRTKFLPRSASFLKLEACKPHIHWIRYKVVIIIMDWIANNLTFYVPPSMLHFVTISMCLNCQGLYDTDVCVYTDIYIERDGRTDMNRWMIDRWINTRRQIHI